VSWTGGPPFGHQAAVYRAAKSRNLEESVCMGLISDPPGSQVWFVSTGLAYCKEKI
jgi:hypothetical protein